MKMERLMEDAANIKRLLPWLESEADIINFMRKIPLDKSHMRNLLTLCYFFKTRDRYLDGFEKQIEDDAREIVLVMPDISYKEIKDRLTVLGDMPNRIEVVLRQLLCKKRDLDKILKEINVSVKKRKNESNNVFALDSTNNHTNINIKIRKVDGSLEVVSSISNEKPSTSKTSSDSDDHSDEPTTSSTSVTSTSSTSNSSNSSPDSTVPSTTTEVDDPCPELTAILNDLVTTSGPFITEPTEPIMPVRTSTVPSVSNSTVPAVPSVEENPEIIEIPNTENENIKPEINVAASSTASHESNTDGNKKPNFNLIAYVKELTLAPELKIFKLCKRLKLDLNERPSEDKFNYLLNQLFDNVVEVESADSAESDSETQEYDFNDDDMIWDVPFSPDNGKQNNDVIVNIVNQPVSTNSTEKEFNLRKPVLNLDAPKFEPAVPLRDVTQPGVPVGFPIIQPARFTPAEPRTNVIPAFPTLPPGFLGAMKVRRNADVGVPKADVGVRPFILNPASKTTETAINLSIDKTVHEPMQLDEPEAGPSNAPAKKQERVLDQNLVLRLIEMFPEACPEYIRNICDGKRWADLDDVVTVILSEEDALDLISLVSPLKHIIENKSTNAVTNQEKAKAWHDIEKSYNERHPLNMRTAEQLAGKYENLKTRARKYAANNRQNTSVTGGGPSAQAIDPISEVMLEIIDKKSVYGKNNNFDDDSQYIYPKIELISEEPTLGSEMNLVTDQNSIHGIADLEQQIPISPNTNEINLLEKNAKCNEFLQRKEKNYSEMIDPLAGIKSEIYAEKARLLRLECQLKENENIYKELQIDLLKDELEEKRQSRNIRLAILNEQLEANRLENELKRKQLRATAK